MHDILMPLPASNLSLVPDALESIAKNTNVPHRYVIIVDGGAPEDFADLEVFLSNFGQPWKLLHNAPSVGLNQSLREGIQECTAKITAIIAPQVRLMEVWFGKVRPIFDRDPVVGIVDTAPNTKSGTLYPIKRAHNRPVDPGCRFAIVQTAFAKKTHPIGDVDPMTFWSRSVMGQGGSSWAAPGVRYIEVEHKAHDLWRPPLVARG